MPENTFDKKTRDNILFSFIIPVYNVKDYLEYCINSILSQTYKNYEIILIDDGSSDGSERICDEYADRFECIKVIHKENEGQAIARNLGVDHVSGDYFLFVDSDDYITDSTLRMIYDSAMEYCFPDIVLSEGILEVNNEGRPIIDSTPRKAMDYRGIDGVTALKQILATGDDCSPCGKCYKTEFWKNNSFYFPPGRISEDFYLIDRIVMKADSVAMVPAYYYYRSQISSSTMHANYYLLIKDTLFSICDWNDYVDNHVSNDELKLLMYHNHAKVLEHTVMANLFYLQEDERQIIVNDLNKSLKLLKYDRSVEGIMIKLCIKFIGFGKTCYLLNVLKRYRKKKLA